MKRMVLGMFIVCLALAGCGGDSAGKAAKAIGTVVDKIDNKTPFVGEWYGKGLSGADLWVFSADGSCDYYYEWNAIGIKTWIPPSPESLKTGKASIPDVQMINRLGSKWVLSGEGGNSGTIFETAASGEKTEIHFEVINGNILKLVSSDGNELLYDRVVPEK